MIGDTIFAVASPPGAGRRGVIRISGPEALPLAAALCGRPLARERAAVEAAVEVLGFPVDCLALVMPGPRSFTGEDVAELHLPGSPLLLEHVGARLREGARDATPGEFTRRAFLNGKLDLAAAEAVLDLIHASSAAERRHAAFVLRGGLGEGAAAARAELLDALALLEAGLDFGDGETGEVPASAWTTVLEHASAELLRLAGSVPRARLGGELALLGAANAGKSSLCNALAGRAAVLVAATAGTTRDVVRVPIARGVALLDTPGDTEIGSDVDRDAIALRDRLIAAAHGAILVLGPDDDRLPCTELPVVAIVSTKSDLRCGPVAPLPGAPIAPHFVVSSTNGAGIDELRAFLVRQCGGGPTGRGQRVVDALGRAARLAAAAAAGAADGTPPEAIAVDVHDALAALDELAGRATPEDVLDRVFARFCLGK